MSFDMEEDMKHIIAYEGKVKTALGLMQEEYISLFLPWANRRVGIEGTNLRPPYAMSNGVEWVRKLEKDKGKHEVFAVLVRTTGAEQEPYQYVGHMGMHNIQWPNGCATTGSVIGADDARGRGVGTEAKLLLLYHSFMVVGLRKIISTVKAFNSQSAGHLIKCGYHFAGRYRQHFFHEGRFVDELHFEIFKEDWEPVWDRYQETGILPKLTDEQRALISKETSS